MKLLEDISPVIFNNHQVDEMVSLCGEIEFQLTEQV